MKRVREIKVDDGENRMTVTVRLESARYLAQHEAKHVIDEATDKVLSVLPTLRYTGFRISRARVR